MATMSKGSRAHSLAVSFFGFAVQSVEDQEKVVRNSVGG